MLFVQDSVPSIAPLISKQRANDEPYRKSLRDSLRPGGSLPVVFRNHTGYVPSVLTDGD